MVNVLCLLFVLAAHGGGHLVASLLLGLRPAGIHPSSTGLRLMLNCGEFPSYKAELAVALGGPLGNLCSGALLWALTLLCHRSGCSTAFLLALCRGVIPLSLFVAGWNLLPISGFDGGRILHCLLLLTPRRAPSPRTADLLLTITSTACVVSLWLFSVYLVLRTARALSLFLFCVQLFWGLWGERLRR